MKTHALVAALVGLALVLPASAEAKGGGSSEGGLFGQRGAGARGPSRSAPSPRSAPSLGGSRGASSTGVPRSAPSFGSGRGAPSSAGSTRSSLPGGSSRGGSPASSGRSSSSSSFGNPGRSFAPPGPSRPSSFGGARTTPAPRSGPGSRSAAPPSRDLSGGRTVPFGGQPTTPGSTGFRSTSPSGSASRGATALPSGVSPSRGSGVTGGFRGATGPRDGSAARPSSGPDRTPGSTFGTAPAGRSTAAGTGEATRGSAPGFTGRGMDGATGRPTTGRERANPNGSVATTTPTSSDTWNDGYRVGYDDGWDDRGKNHAKYGHQGNCYDDWYDDDRWYLSFSFGASCGPYAGVGYYSPYRSWTFGVDYAFFYPAPVTWCYAPYGFYSSYTPVYVTRYETVRETVPVYVYETRTVYTREEIEEKRAAGETGPVAPPPEGAEVKVADPVPAAGSPATERLLRDASDLFREKKYYDAAVKFRLAAIGSPDLPGPLFALGQSLLALGQDEYAAKVLRKAVSAHPALLGETGDIAGVYADQAEFDRVMAELEMRAADAPADGDARFLLAYQRYFSGDPRCRADLDGLLAVAPADGAAKLLRTAADTRFKAADDLPPIK